VLGQQPPATLDLLLREGLDLCAHRLDAWITSLATRRLDAERESYAGGEQGAVHGQALDRRARAPPEARHWSRPTIVNQVPPARTRCPTPRQLFDETERLLQLDNGGLERSRIRRARGDLVPVEKRLKFGGLFD